MARSTYEGTKALMNGQRPFVLTRASYSGIQKFSAEWTGDNFASDEHMLLGQRLLNSMGVSGIPYVGMDVGGFMGEPTTELYVRWMNLGIYSPLFRNHTTIDSRSHEPWLFGEANTRFIRGLLEQRYKLLPYLYSSFYQAHVSGMPVNRMLPIEYTHDNMVYNDKFSNQFLFGDNILVCPADSKTMASEIYLPGNGMWYRMSNDEMFKGGSKALVASPLDDMPVFVKEGGIVPMQSVIQSTKEKGDGILSVHIWKGTNANSFVYYEDDGNTFDYENGGFYKRTMTYNPKDGEVIFNAKEGKYATRFEMIKLILHGFDTMLGSMENASVDNKRTPATKEGNTYTLSFVNSNNEIRIQLR